MVGLPKKVSLLCGWLFVICSFWIIFMVYRSGQHTAVPRHFEYEQEWRSMVQQNQFNSVEETLSPISTHHSPALQYCNFPNPNDENIAEEGKPPHSQWILKQVQVVIRHGDRSPIDHNLYNSLGIIPDYCQLRADRKPSHTSLSKFMQTTFHDQIKMLQQGRKLLDSPYPHLSVCGSATLSQLGVVQHILNGELLRNAYTKQNFLSKAIQDRLLIKKEVYVATTERSRTMQSAIALLFGFIPDFHLNEVDIKYMETDTFGFNPASCDAILSMGPSIKKVQYKSYLDHRRKPAFRKLAEKFGVGDHSGALIDRFVTGFLCKGMKLPCKNGVCVTVEDLDTILDAETTTTWLLSEKSAFVNKSMLLLQPLLNQLSGFMVGKSLGKATPSFSLFSGHDTTLKPLIRALGIPEYRWPKPGSRIVFELWWDPGEEKNYVRILLNGKDYTMVTKPCAVVNQSDTGGAPKAKTCEAEKFHSYAKHGIFQHFGFQTRKEACQKPA